MSNLFDKLFGITAIVEPDKSWPVETTGYYEDTSVPVIYSPPIGALQDEWAPTFDQVVPGYRGTEEHGVPFNTDSTYVDPGESLPENTDTPSPVDTVHQEPMDPIPVNVVSMPLPHGKEQRLTTSSFVIQASAQPIRFVPKSLVRTRLILTVASSDVVNISTDSQQAISQGFPVTQWSHFELYTSQALWAYNPSPSVDVTIYVIEEYPVSVNEHPI